MRLLLGRTAVCSPPVDPTVSRTTLCCRRNCMSFLSCARSLAGTWETTESDRESGGDGGHAQSDSAGRRGNRRGQNDGRGHTGAENATEEDPLAPGEFDRSGAERGTRFLLHVHHGGTGHGGQQPGPMWPPTERRIQ